LPRKAQDHSERARLLAAGCPVTARYRAVYQIWVEWPLSRRRRRDDPQP
jgi:hypothetical protein